MSAVTVVGAGISGLVAATELERVGHDVTVLDKGRGVGGRMASRRIGEVVVDHGAQFFTTKSDEGSSLVEAWRTAGAVEVWHESLVGADGEHRVDGHERLRGAPSMTGPAKLLAAGLRDVRTATKVEHVEYVGGRWRCIAGDLVVDADALVMTPPLPQTLDLLATVDLDHSVRERLAAVAYHPCIAVLAVLDGPAGLPAPGAVRPSGGPVEWLADNRVKGVTERPALTIHLRPEQSEGWWDHDDDRIAGAALAAVRRWCEADAVEVQVHRWRFARPVERLEERSLTLVHEPPLVAAGDVFGGPLVEGAARSGLDAGRRVSAALDG